MLENVERVTRTFYPVGQGAFYRERFVFSDKSVFNIVYDCGTETPKGKYYIDNIISGWKDECIDILFISHFHVDHISKVSELIENIKVKLLIAPFLTLDDKKYIKIDILNDCTEKNNEEINYDQIINAFSIIDNIGETFKNNVDKIKLVAKERINKTFDNRNVEVIEEGNISQILNNEKFKNTWILDSFVALPTNKREIINIFKTKFRDINEINSIGKIKDILEDKIERNKLKELYGDNIHKFCLVLYSGPANNGIFQHNYKYCKERNCQLPYFPSCKNTKPAGCLYTGDFETKDENSVEEFVKHFNRYFEKIGCLQLPHHGSENNFIDLFLSFDCFYVCCYGKNNRYGHPSNNVLCILAQFYKIVFKINENSWKIEFKIDMRNRQKNLPYENR